MSDLVHNTATATIAAVGKHAQVKSVVLTPAAAKSTVVVRTGGASGTVKLALQAAADGSSVIWESGNEAGVLFPDGIHITVTGAGALVDVEYTQSN